jgi:hypothetical protein
MEHGHAGGNLHASVGSGSTGGNGSGRHQLGVAVRPDHLAGCENMKLSVRYFNGYFLVTGPDTEPAKFKTRQQALTWCAAHYPDLPIKENRPGGKRLAANKPASSGDKQ